MTKIELAIRTVEWKIEDAERDIEDYRGRIERMVAEGSFKAVESEFVLTYAKHMDEASKKLQALNEQLHMLQSLADEQ